MMKRPGQKKPRVGRFAQQGSPVPQSPKKRLHRLLVLLAFVIMVAAITRLPEQEEFSVQDIDTSQVAESTIKAKFSFETEDLAATEQLRGEVAAKVPTYYRVDQDRVERQEKVLTETVNRINNQRDSVQKKVIEALKNSNSSQEVKDVVSAAIMDYCIALKKRPDWADMPEASDLALWLTPDSNSLPKRQFAPSPEGAEPGQQKALPVQSLFPEGPLTFTFTYGNRLNDIARDGLLFVLNHGIRMARLPQSQLTRRIVIVRDAMFEDQMPSGEIQLSQVPDPKEAVTLLEKRLQDVAKLAARETDTPNEWPRLVDAARAVAQPALTDTIREDIEYTRIARDRARDRVEPVMKKIPSGYNIIEDGNLWDEQRRSDVKTYISILEDDERPAQRFLSVLLAHFIIVGLILACVYRSVGLFRQTPSEEAERPLNLAILLMACTVVVGRIVSYFEPSGFVLPVAAIGILYAILVNGRLASMISVLTALLVSIQYGYDWRLLIVQSAMAMAGVFSIYRVRRRSDMAGASITALFIGVLTMLAVTLALDNLFSETTVQHVTLILFNGFTSLLIVPGVLSPLERLFGITTDIQLLEYSDLNNTLLSELAVKAPATFAHSLMLGQLAEAAADAIGANGLLARVCAYYHDIGKMWRSEFYSENQNGRNIHDELSPRLSARAIASHVVQGMELAKDHHLPQAIIDAILEHHGTCLIGYFYEQALEQQKHGDVHEADFRYPGPKPQSQETAILMICDAVESGVRSLKTPNRERVREFVDKIISKRSADRQFDDANLTFKQLDTIAAVVTDRIMISLHTRVAYPDTHESREVDNVIPMSGGAE